jgi:hypothetical protein
MEGDRVVTVTVSTELLAQLREWSLPVEVQIVETSGGTGYVMNFRTHQCEKEILHFMTGGAHGRSDGEETPA